jgi:hypothetical protein
MHVGADLMGFWSRTDELLPVMITGWCGRGYQPIAPRPLSRLQ